MKFRIIASYVSTTGSKGSRGGRGEQRLLGDVDGDGTKKANVGVQRTTRKYKISFHYVREIRERARAANFALNFARMGKRSGAKPKVYKVWFVRAGGFRSSTRRHGDRSILGVGWRGV